MDIRIHQTWPQIGIKTQSAKLNLKNNAKVDYTMSHTQPKIKIRSTLPKVKIDQTQCFSDAGLKGIKDFMNEVVQLAKKTVTKYIRREAAQGDRLAQIEKGGKPILDAIQQEVNQKLDYNVGLMPKHRPDITVKEGKVNIQVREGRIEANFNYIPIEGTYVPGKVTIYLKQKGSITIEYVGNNVDEKV